MSLLRDILAVLITGILMLYFLALQSFSPQDPSFFTYSSPAGEIHNLAGLWGAHLSSSLFYTFGLGAYLFLVLGLESLRRVLFAKTVSLKNMSASVVFLTLGLGPILINMREFMFFEGFPLLTGGVLGRLEQRLLEPYLGRVGGLILFGSLFAIGLLLVFEKNIFSWGASQIKGVFLRLKKKPFPGRNETPEPKVF